MRQTQDNGAGQPEMRTRPAPVEVVLCAYNGEKYIREQVASILRQTLKPARLSVYDDGSSDGTPEILADLARRNGSDVEIVLHRNSRNLGYVRNFEQGIRQAECEFIALSDQDDIWEENKLEVLLASFDEGTGVVFSDALLVDEAAASLGHTLWESIRLSPARRARFGRRSELVHLMLQQSFVTGAAMVLRRSVADALPAFPATAPHDYWIAIVASEISSVKPVDRVLYKYRQHASNVMGQRKHDPLRKALQILRTAEARYQGELRTYEQIALALQGRPGLEAACERFRAKAGFLRARQDAIAAGWRGLPRLVRMLFAGQYRTFCVLNRVIFLQDACILIDRALRRS
ncbi:hypothetical protein GCM10028796_37620 [Ramlibacter monticola]|uniref:Glycosyltransferase family 2 protein n=1 Tax=Ramlibacter monticola TaxID=1926872 RepID=A0A936Z6Q7_9BURK|nr:glycosyltransferase family 2 protein [Ramlibacter monticola]MBL0395037.1 glycosyltransferase family 2 protein [Ramlibacter monticola]